MDISFFWFAVGLAALGYFIGDGLKNMNGGTKGSGYRTLIKESDLHYYISLDREALQELLEKNPSAPKIVLKGTTYYPYRQFMDWLSSNEIYKN
ncbi:hypothetical protein [Lysinibacillus odysseyi]|uniref:DNA-binding protein n=1 Tax=Lysinibacillus odysseyi 34hs-1 = NBRC 100172 TaxID=1220589 RepID=A0A0A3J4M3_9BACI|nr:hypothetical protein [Lysinibacillus odysseyi]KGR82007.1 hypothetical protein CD32_22195 [Lysinibacillus odysseyi 34hs-1 = NBRC 100172]